MKLLSSLPFWLLLLLSTAALAQKKPNPTAARVRVVYEQALAKHDTLAMADAAYILGQRYRLSKSLMVNLTHIDWVDSHQAMLAGRPIALPAGSRRSLLGQLNVVRTR